MAKLSLSEEQIETWRGRVEVAKEYQRQRGNTDKRWDKYVKAMAGDFNTPNDLGPEGIDVNMVYATNKTALPSLWLTEPHVTFRPTRATIEISGKRVNNIRRAEFSEVEVNYWFRELKIREKVMRPMVLDAEATNHGYAYVWYVKNKTDVEMDGERTEPNPLVRFRDPIVRRVSPKNLLFAPGKWDLEDMPWIVVEWVMRWEDALTKFDKNEETLKPTAAITGASETAAPAVKDYMDSPDAKFVRIQQVWDKRNKKILTFAFDGCDEQLAEDKWSVDLEGFPIVDLSFVDIPDEYYGSPPIQYYYPQNKELNAARTSQRRRYNRSKSVIMAAADIADEFKEAYKNAADGDILSIETGGDDIRSKILIDGGLQPDPGVAHYESRIRDDLLNVTGLSAEQRGGGDPNVDTATSSANIQQGVQIRSGDRGDRVRTAYLTIARKLWMLLRQIPDEKRDRLVSGEVAGQFKEVQYSLSELQGEFALEMDLGSVLPDSPATRQTLATNRYLLFRQDPLANPEQLILDVFKSQNVANPQQYLLFLREPQEELQMMLQGLPVEPHERDQHEQHLEMHDAQADQLEEALEQMDPDDDMGRKIRFAIALLMAHINSTTRVLESIAQGAGRTAGNPVNNNQLRTGQKRISGAETAAELGGNPL